MKYLLVIAVILSACDTTTGVEKGTEINDQFHVININLEDKKLQCVEVRGYQIYGLSCNWDKFNKENK